MYYNNNDYIKSGDGFGTPIKSALLRTTGNGRGGWKDDGKIYSQWF